MTDYAIIGAVDETLRTLLWSFMQHDSQMTAIIGSEQQISYEPPFRLVQDVDADLPVLSLYVYRVAENEQLKNQAPALIDGAIRRAPLALNLFYLITPLTNSSENDQRLLGKVMHVLYDRPIIRDPDLQGALAGTADELRVILNPFSLEDATRLWGAFMRPLRLSLSYEVKVVFIDSEQETDADEVRRKRLEFCHIAPT